MKVILLLCLLPAVLCWEYPGYPGVDCPTARQKMSEDPKSQWMLPKCNADGTYQDMQCSDSGEPDTCMCTYKDGSPITLPWFGINISSCICPAIVMDQMKLHPELEDADEACERTGYFKALQCNKKTKECWCVTRYGNQVAPPSPDRKSCDEFADKY